MYLQYNNKQKNLFLWHRESHRRKEQDPDLYQNVTVPEHCLAPSLKLSQPPCTLLSLTICKPSRATQREGRLKREDCVMSVSSFQWSFYFPEAESKEKHAVFGPYAGVDYITSPYVDSRSRL